METHRQDMPPPGGFTRVVYERVPLKPYWPAPVKWLIYLGVSAIGWGLYREDMKRKSYRLIEKRAAMFSILPLLVAENDRAKLKALKKARDAEKELMKDVEDWEVGTLFGNPVYKSLKPDEYSEPSLLELWAHSNPADLVPIRKLYSSQ